MALKFIIAIVVVLIGILYWYRYIYSGTSLIIYGQGETTPGQFTISIQKSDIPTKNIVGSTIIFISGGKACTETIISAPVESGSKVATFNTTNTSQLDPNTMFGIRAYIKYPTKSS